MSTWNRLDLETLGYRTDHAQKSPRTLALMQAHLYARQRKMHFCTNEDGQKHECGIVSDSFVLFTFSLSWPPRRKSLQLTCLTYPQRVQAQIIQSTIMCTYEGAYHGSTITRSISSMPRLFIASTKGPCSFTVASHSAYSTASCAHTKEEDEEPPVKYNKGWPHAWFSHVWKISSQIYLRYLFINWY